MIAFLDSKRRKFVQWEIPDFFSKLTFHVNQTFKTWGESLQFAILTQYGLVSCKQSPPVSIGLTFWVVAYGKFDCIAHVCLRILY